MHKVAVSLILIIFVILVSIAVAFLIFRPMQSSATPIIFQVKSGRSSRLIAEDLAHKNLIRTPLAFNLLTRFTGTSRKLMAGTYRLSGAMNSLQIFYCLRDGKAIMRKFVVPEGKTLNEIAQIYEQSGFGSGDQFRQAARDPNWQVKYNIESDFLEGYLFPDTYYFGDSVSAETVIQTMLKRFDRQWTDNMKKAADAISMSRHDIITLASIIEMEATLSEERAVISGVFHNRLRLGWRLDADPTVIYGLGDPKRPLTKSDLKKDTPYNTYVHRGLPPGPICNPGESCILAALYPDDVPYFFFVAIDNISHHFSKSLQEHQRMIGEIKRKKNLTRF